MDDRPAPEPTPPLAPPLALEFKSKKKRTVNARTNEVEDREVAGPRPVARVDNPALDPAPGGPMTMTLPPLCPQPVPGPRFGTSRPTCRFDFAKDLCKDYNESGYCVFGDTCIFLHDRGDYKSGWELELEWSESIKKRGAGKGEGGGGGGMNSMNAKTNPLCPVCAMPFTSPVTADCGDKFCEACALHAFSTSKHCPKCKQAWKGSFRVVR